jgi:excisionase family DNA binding protein
MVVPVPLLSIREVATRPGVCRATAYRLMEKGALPHVRVSNAVRVRPEDLAAFIQLGGRP